MLDVGQHHLGEVDLEQVDLLLQDQGQQQVERALEDLEVEVEAGGARIADLGPAPGSDAHGGAHSARGPSVSRRARVGAGHEHALQLLLVAARL